MRVGYNEIDPYCCAWLENLMMGGLLPIGKILQRDIRELTPDDVRGYDQFHFFAGLGGWPLALEMAGWNEPCWTGSCPCPPFSSAGKTFRCPLCDTSSPVPNAVRTGAFNCIRCDHEWQADERHLWPEFFRLIRECHPDRIFGEQVASSDGRTWLDIVSASLEMASYSVASPSLPACGVGAPHIRQRLWFMADTMQPRRSEWRSVARNGSFAGSGGFDELADTDSTRPSAWKSTSETVGQRRSTVADGGRSEIIAMGHSSTTRLERSDSRAMGYECTTAERTSSFSVLGDTESNKERESRIAEESMRRPCETRRPSSWSDLEWLSCRDGKARPTKPGIFPLAHGVSNRVGMLRGAGNAIVPQVAAEFVSAFMLARDDMRRST